MFIRLFALPFLLLLHFASPAQNDNNIKAVKTNAGLVSGISNKDGDIHIYKGIPFAAPPIGNLRWKEPQPVVAWSGVKKCDAFSASPMQAKPSPFGVWTEEFLIPKEPISEDCLYLNVWTGAKKSTEKRPVIVWIYGGGFSSGGAGCAIYDGEAMAKKGIVFVSINYRVGIFGFFAHPELTKESDHHASGNYALMDQVAALKWVQKNIAAFGGDVNNVTIAGQSAGSMSVNCLVASPLTKGLFHRAIAESGASFVSSPFRAAATLQQGEEAGVKLAETLKVSSLEALRNMKADELFSSAKVQASPIIDGYVLPETIERIFAKGMQNDVPVLTGWNEDDGLLFGPPNTAAEWQKQAGEQYGNNADVFLKFYPATDDAAAAASQLANSRDVIFGVQNYTWANVQTATGKSKVYLYNFTRKVPATGEFVKYGAFHTGEVAYAYNNLKFLNNRPFEKSDEALADLMSSYWVNFAITGNPNGAGLPEWPVYTAKDNMVMILDEKSAAKKLPSKEALDFLYDKISAK